MVLGRDSAEVLPSGWFPLAVFLRVTCLRSGGGGFGWLSLAGPYVLRDVIPGACLLLSSSPLALHGVVSPSPVCLSRAPAFRQVRVAMLAEGSVESPSVLVLAFPSSLFLVEGSSDGSAPGDRSSPLDGCVYSLRFLLRSVASALSLLGVVGLFFLLCLSVYCRKWWYLSSWKLVGVPVGFTSSSPLLGGVLFDLVPILSWVFSPGFGQGFSLSRVVRHRSGFLLLSSSSGLVAVFCQSSLAARSVVLWRWGVRSSVFTLFPPVVRGTLVLTGWSRHCRITAGLASMDMPLLVSLLSRSAGGTVRGSTAPVG